jgi:hypothetical protein
MNDELRKMKGMKKHSLSDVAWTLRRANLYKLTN